MSILKCFIVKTQYINILTGYFQNDFEPYAGLLIILNQQKDKIGNREWKKEKYDMLVKQRELHQVSSIFRIIQYISILISIINIKTTSGYAKWQVFLSICK